MVELRDLKEQIVEKDKKIEIFQNNELEFRKKMRELEDQKKNVDLEIVRRLDEEREKIKQNAIEMFTEQHRFKDLEKDKKINDMAKMIEGVGKRSNLQKSFN